MDADEDKNQDHKSLFLSVYGSCLNAMGRSMKAGVRCSAESFHVTLATDESGPPGGMDTALPSCRRLVWTFDHG